MLQLRVVRWPGQARSILSIPTIAAPLAIAALTALVPRAASAQDGYAGCYIESYTPDGMPNYNCDSRNRRGPAPPPAPDVWGAIAVSGSTLMSFDSWNYKSEADASKAALARCASDAHESDCKVVLTVADVCASLAISKPEKVYAIGGPGGAANFTDKNAILHCQRAGGHACAVNLSFCADGVRHVLNVSNGAPAGRRQ
jgi:hypothetical protein